MIGELGEGFARVKASKDLERRNFGVKRGEYIFLHPVEAVYLQLAGKVEFSPIEELFKWAEKYVEDFPTYYFVYEDLRNRGFRARPQGEYILAKKAYYPVSERKEVRVAELADRAVKFDEFVLAIVDEESEITYYQISVVDINGEQKESLKKFKGFLLKDRVITDDVEIFNRYFYGSKVGNFVALSLIESAYLVEMGVLDVGVDKETFFNFAKKVEDNFDRRYEVYKDLKNRNFVVKTGFKFGSDFRVYSKVRSVRDLPHSEYLIAIVDDRKLRLSEIARAVRLAHSVRKKMIFVCGQEYVCFERVRV